MIKNFENVINQCVKNMIKWGIKACKSLPLVRSGSKKQEKNSVSPQRNQGSLNIFNNFACLRM